MLAVPTWASTGSQRLDFCGPARLRPSFRLFWCDASRRRVPMMVASGSLVPRLLHRLWDVTYLGRRSLFAQPDDHHFGLGDQQPGSRRVASSRMWRSLWAAAHLQLGLSSPTSQGPARCPTQVADRPTANTTGPNISPSIPPSIKARCTVLAPIRVQKLAPEHGFEP